MVLRFRVALLTAVVALICVPGGCWRLYLQATYNAWQTAWVALLKEAALHAVEAAARPVHVWLRLVAVNALFRTTC